MILFTIVGFLAIATMSCSKDNVDEGAPTVTIIGKEIERVLAPKTYTDPGATATDEVDGDVTSSIVAHSSINYSSPNCTYDIQYTATDATGNEGSSIQRLVMLIDLNVQFGFLSGNLNYWDTPTYTIQDTLTFHKFAGYDNAIVKTYMPNDSTINIPTQTVMCGATNPIVRTFSGSGTIKYKRSGSGIITTFNINYTQVDIDTTLSSTITN